MGTRPRTQDDFNTWFATQGDPWNYQGCVVRDRLTRSLEFITRHVSPKFSGHFLELGAYDGSFSLLLLERFSHARLTINDISEIALERAQKAVSERFGQSRSPGYLRKDTISIGRDDLRESQGRPDVLLMLECLYYLNDDERLLALRNLSEAFPGSSLFISAPITGYPYFTDETLRELLESLGYACVDFEVLNFRRLSWLSTPLRGISRHCAWIRRKLANQVIFFFKKSA